MDNFVDSSKQLCATRRQLLGTGACLLLAGAANPQKVIGQIESVKAIHPDNGSGLMACYLPALKTNHSDVNKAFRIAIGDLMTNVQPFGGGMLESERLAILAGLNYDRPWTRDASINVWNWGASIVPGVAKNTLLCVLKKHDSTYIVGGQYWDAVIWITSAWNYYLFTGDEEFLQLAFNVAKATLQYFEQTEFDSNSNLFWGPACYGDGIAAYPDYYAAHCGTNSGIIHWPKYNETKGPGVGIPVKTLSTNCLYYHAYTVVSKMAKHLNQSLSDYNQKAVRLKDSINQYFWDESKGSYVYLADSAVNSDHQEGLGISFAIMFGVADEVKREVLFSNAKVTKHGIACVWPSYDRYTKMGGFGRHSGTVWPHVQGFWADAAAMYGKLDIFSHELFTLAGHASRDYQFAEIYHPETGAIYGGLQERRGKIKLWKSTNRQTWSATAYLRMVLNGLVGIRFDLDSVRFAPQVPEKISSVSVSNVCMRQMVMDIDIKGTGNKVQGIQINGKVSDGLIPLNHKGKISVQIQMK